MPGCRPSLLAPHYTFGIATSDWRPRKRPHARHQLWSAGQADCAAFAAHGLLSHGARPPQARGSPPIPSSGGVGAYRRILLGESLDKPNGSSGQGRRHSVCGWQRMDKFFEERKLVDAPRPALYGLFKVQSLLRNGREAAAGDPRSWKWIAIDGRGFAVQLSSAEWERRRADFDDPNQGITVSSGRQRKSSLTYSRTGPDDVVIKGVLDNQSTEIVLRRMPEPRFALNDAVALRWPSIW